MKGERSSLLLHYTVLYTQNKAGLGCNGVRSTSPLNPSRKTSHDDLQEMLNTRNSWSADWLTGDIERPPDVTGLEGMKEAFIKGDKLLWSM